MIYLCVFQIVQLNIKLDLIKCLDDRMQLDDTKAPFSVRSQTLWFYRMTAN